MSIVRLELSQLRNITSLTLDAHPQLNVVTGPNGSGKTSLLEGLYLLGRGRSFRTSKRASLIQEGSDCCRLFARFQQKDRASGQLGMEFCSRSRRIRLNGEDILKSAALARALPLQFLNQQSFALVDQGPSVRRKFLDWGVFHVEPGFFSCWQHYQRALQQRNAALRQGNSEIQVWNDEIETAAQPLHTFRHSYATQLKKAFEQRICTLLPEAPVTVEYLPGWGLEKSLGQTMKDDWLRDKRRGFTHSGPHRADLSFMLPQGPAIERLSRGQQKLLVSALTLAQADLYAESMTKPCVMLVDDITAELDSTHSGALLGALIKTGAQVFLTTTDPGLLGDSLTIPHAVFHVEHGELKATKVI